MDFNKFKCRCSAIGKIMSNSRSNAPLTEKQQQRLRELSDKPNITENQKIELAELKLKEEKSKDVVLSDTCISYLMEWYALNVYGKKSIQKEFDIVYTKKGKLVEGDSLLLLSVVEGEIYQKNTERVENDYLSGEPDTYVGETIMTAEKIIDIKSSFDYPIFLDKINKSLDKDYEQQIQGYCDITGAAEGEVAYCLVDMPEIIMNDYKRKLLFSGAYISEEDTRFLRDWEDFRHSMIFEDIPPTERVYRIKVEPFTPAEQQKLYDRVKQCRDWLFTFHEQYKKINN